MLRKNADVIELFASSEIRGVESGKCRAAHRAKAGRYNQPNSKHDTPTSQSPTRDRDLSGAAIRLY
jgi:hypothetical protein